MLYVNAPKGTRASTHCAPVRPDPGGQRRWSPARAPASTALSQGASHFSESSNKYQTTTSLRNNCRFAEH